MLLIFFESSFLLLCSWLYKFCSKKHLPRHVGIKLSTIFQTKHMSRVQMHHSYRIFRAWMWEIIAVIIAISLFAAITTLLVFYNGKQSPKWGAYLSLNALLALLSTIFRAMLVVVVSQVISQRKWLWYNCARPLSDFQKFDSGSRGSLGAMMLLPTVFWRDLVTLVAASILFASFLVGPTVQQASRTRQCAFPVPGNATLPYTHHARGGYTCNTGTCTMSVPSIDTIVAILSGVTVPTGVENQIRPTCTTGNCTFPGGDPMNFRKDPKDKESTTHSTTAMCSKCINIESLVLRQRSEPDTTNETTRYTLPTGFNFSMYPAELKKNIHIMTERKLNWMGDLFTPEFKSLSRWAYANITFITVNQYRNLNTMSTPEYDRSPGNVTAVVCSLYPCLRTYVASITDNRLVEKEVSTQVMKVDLSESKLKHLSPSEGVGIWLSTNSWDIEKSTPGDFTAVRSPCGVAGKILDISTNMSFHPGGTKLALYDFTGQGGSLSNQYTPQDITVPEQCIYRHDPFLARAISMNLQGNIFNGRCWQYSEGLTATSCQKDYWNGGNTESNGQLSNLGLDTVMRTLYNDGNANFLNITRWFEEFAVAMTNRFRTNYMSASFTGNNGTALTTATQDLGFSKEIQGLAWQTTECVAMYWEWLMLPFILISLTTFLSIWTIATNWQHRHSRPVWKESILPLIIYGYKIRYQEPGMLPDQFYTGTTNQEEDGSLSLGDVLLETNEMDEMGNKVAISFDWPLKAVTSTERTRANSSAVALQQGNSSTRRRSRQSATSQSLRPTDSSSQLEELVSLRLSQDIDASVQVSLLETDESIRLHDLASSRNSDDINTGTGQNTVDCVAQPTRIPQTLGETYNNAG
jgi:hypothetical protein